MLFVCPLEMFAFSKVKKYPVVPLRKSWATTTDIKKKKKDSFNSSPWEDCSNCLKKLYFTIAKDKPFCISYSSEKKNNTCLCLIIIFYCFTTQILIQRLISLIFGPIKILEFYSHLATFSIAWNKKNFYTKDRCMLSMTKHFLFIFSKGQNLGYKHWFIHPLSKRQMGTS